MKGTGNKGRRRLPSPAMIVAVVALVAALGGSAVALQGKNSVKGNDIAKGAVKSRAIATGAVNSAKIAQGAVGAPDMDVFRNANAAVGVSTGSGPPVDLGGPSVTISVPAGGLVGIYARADLLATGGGMDGGAQVHLFEPALLADSPAILSAPNGTGSFVGRYTAPGAQDTGGVAAQTRGGMITIAPPPGTYTFSLRYSSAGGANASIQNRSLWAGVIN